MAVAATANTNTGYITVRLGTPAARMAVISPSLESRPSPIRIPISTPNGMVSGSTCGSASRNRYSIDSQFEELRTTTSNSLPGLLQKDDGGGQKCA